MTHSGGGGPRNVKDILREISAYTSYLEDISKSDKSKLDPHRDKKSRLEVDYLL
jgi:hypothetical protein